MSLPIEEQWRAVPGYEGRYEISDQGRVRSLPRRFVPELKVMKQKLDTHGYRRVGLSRDGVTTSEVVHRLVALAFIGPCPEGHEVRHLDGDRTNPALANLAYGSRSQNIFDAIKHGTHQQTRKTHCPSGHPYNAENTYSPPSRPRWRYCRACDEARKSKQRATA